MANCTMFALRADSFVSRIRLARPRLLKLGIIAIFFLILTASLLTDLAVNAQISSTSVTASPMKYPIYKEKFSINTTAYNATLNLGPGMFIYNFSATAVAIPPSITAPLVNVSWTPISFSFARNSTQHMMLSAIVYLYLSSSVSETNFTINEKSGWSNITIYSGGLAVRALSLYDSQLGKYVESVPSVGILTKSGPLFTVSDTFRGNVPRSVLAYYYAWYSPNKWTSAGRNCTGCPSVTGMPVSGFYNSQNTTLIDQQISLAQRVGIAGFLSDWGGDNNFADAANGLVFQEAQKMGFKVTVYYEAKALLNLTQSLAQTKFVNDTQYILATYGSSPEMLRINGVPAIFVFYADGLSLAFWRSAIPKIKSVYPNVYFIGDTFNYTYYDVFDGLSSYNLNFQSVTSSNSSIINGTLTNYYYMEIEANLHNKLLFTPTMPGFDNINDGLESVVYWPRDNGSTYLRAWTLAFNSNPDGITIASWNEWHEGTNIEPAIVSPDYWANPNQYLYLTKQEISGFVNHSSLVTSSGTSETTSVSQTTISQTSTSTPKNDPLPVENTSTTSTSENSSAISTASHNQTTNQRQSIQASSISITLSSQSNLTLAGTIVWVLLCVGANMKYTKKSPRH